MSASRVQVLFLTLYLLSKIQIIKCSIKLQPGQSDYRIPALSPSSLFRMRKLRFLPQMIVVKCIYANCEE